MGFAALRLGKLRGRIGDIPWPVQRRDTPGWSRGIRPVIIPAPSAGVAAFGRKPHFYRRRSAETPLRQQSRLGESITDGTILKAEGRRLKAEVKTKAKSTPSATTRRRISISCNTSCFLESLVLCGPRFVLD